MTPASPPQPAPWKVTLVLCIGLISVSTAAIFIRLAFQASGQTGVGFSLVLSASRLSIAALVFLPAWRNVGKSINQGNRGDRPWLFSAAAGVFLAIHFACWITSLSYTSIAASTALVTTNPAWTALLSWLWWGERPTRTMSFGIAIALMGSLLVSFAGGTSTTAASQPLLGNGLALAGSWAATLYLLLGREAQRRGLEIGSHVVLTYTAAAALLLPLPLLFGSGYGGYSATVYLCMLLIGVFPQTIGHTSFNWAVRWISPTLVMLTILAEPIGSSVLGILVFRENPGTQVWLGAAVILAGVAIAIL
ncbi:MAG: DMT family transporter, partial [Cyanobacteria bacterium P01_D01_bin.128]